MFSIRCCGRHLVAIGQKLFLTAESVSNIENGKTMCMPENVAKICELFDVAADYIYYGIEGVIKEENSLE